MAIVAEIPTDPTIAPDTPQLVPAFAKDFRPNINAYLVAIEDKVQRAVALLEKLQRAVGKGSLSGGAVTAGAGLTVNVDPLEALVGTHIATDAAQNFGGFGNGGVNRLFLRQDGTWTIPAAFGAGPPLTNDGHGDYHLWATVTTAGGVVTAIDNTVRVTFQVALLAASGAGTGDMSKSVYDTNNNNIVDVAATAPWAGLTGVPATFAPSAHHTSHENGGGDQLALSAAQLTSGSIPAGRYGAATIPNSAMSTAPVTIADIDNEIEAKAGKPLFKHHADAGNVSATGETNLYSDTIAAGQLANNDEELLALWAGSFVASVTATRQLRVYFAGTLIFDTGALSISAGADAWTINCRIIRVSSSVVRCSVWANVTGAALNAFDAYTEITGLTLSNTQVLKITGQAAGTGNADNDIVARMGSVNWQPAP